MLHFLRKASWGSCTRSQVRPSCAEMGTGPGAGEHGLGRGLGLGVCSDCPSEFRAALREVPPMARLGKFWEAPRHFCSSWTNRSVIEEAEWCGEAG